MEDLNVTEIKEEQSFGNYTTKEPYLTDLKHACYLDPRFNNDLIGMITNNWNMSCACVLERADGENVYDLTRIYRFDVRDCVDINECLFNDCEKGKGF